MAVAHKCQTALSTSAQKWLCRWASIQTPFCVDIATLRAHHVGTLLDPQLGLAGPKTILDLVRKCGILLSDIPVLFSAWRGALRARYFCGVTVGPDANAPTIRRGGVSAVYASSASWSSSRASIVYCYCLMLLPIATVYCYCLLILPIPFPIAICYRLLPLPLSETMA